jgi:hypothetical protein
MNTFATVSEVIFFTRIMYKAKKQDDTKARESPIKSSTVIDI